MYCPKCNSRTKVTDSREIKNFNGIRRRRICKNKRCLHRITTFEYYENSEHLTELRKLRAKIKLIKAFIKNAQDILGESD